MLASDVNSRLFAPTFSAGGRTVHGPRKFRLFLRARAQWQLQLCMRGDDACARKGSKVHADARIKKGAVVSREDKRRIHFPPR